MSIPKDSSLYKNYQQALIDLDKPACVCLILDALESGDIGIVDLYQDLLSPVLNDLVDSEMDNEDAIWLEHVRSEITRTVVECCYPYVQKLAAAKKQSLANGSNGRVMIVLPDEEYHELGARIGTDLFLINGYDALFVGSNTPRDAIIKGIVHFKPDYIDIHVVNYYNLFKAKENIRLIHALDPKIKILASGYAFYHDPVLTAKVGPVCLVQTNADIESLQEGKL